MEVVSGNTLLPGDPRLIDHIVCELKSQGIFDQFRKECIADVDTKPAYQNLRQRVEGSVTGFLKTQVWRPDLNKNQLREALRKNIYESGFLETGVERIVDQVVNPKINTVFLPQVEEVVYKFLGLEKPVRSFNGPLTINTIDLLPTDLDPISPDSEVLDKALNKSDKTNEESALDDSKLDDFESPPFEPIVNEQQTILNNDESSNDSKISGISGLTSHDSNLSAKEEKSLGPDITNPDSQLSKVSSNSRLSIITNESKHTPEKMDISEESTSSEKEENVHSFGNGLLLSIQQDDKDELEAIKMEINGGYNLEKEMKEEKKEMKEAEEEEEDANDDDDDKMVLDMEQSPIDEETTTKSEIIKEEVSEEADRTTDDNFCQEDKEQKKIETKEKEKQEVKDKDVKEKEIKEKDGKEKETKEKTESKEKSDRHRHDSEKRRERDKDKKSDRDNKDKDRKYSSSSSKSSSKDKDKYKDKSKENKAKEKEKDPSRSKDEKEKNKDEKSKEKDLKKDEKSEKSRSSSSSKHTSRDRTKSDSKSDSKATTTTRKDDKKKSDDKIRKSDSKTKDDKSKSREHSSKHSSRDRKSSSSKDVKDKKDSKDSKPKPKREKDDHSSSREKKDSRRSADRDSNDGSSGNGNNSSNISKESKESSKSKSSDSSDSNSGSNSGSNSRDSGQSDSQTCLSNVEQQNLQKNSKIQTIDLKNCPDSEIVLVLQTDVITNDVDASLQNIKIKKPKIASNIFEARRLMKVRKKLEKLEKKRQKKMEIASASLDSPNLELDGIEDTDSMDSEKQQQFGQDKSENNEKNNSVITKESWDAIEEKLNQSINKNVDFNSYIDDNNDSSSNSKPDDVSNKCKRVSEDEDCLYFNNQISPTTQRFLKSVETYQKNSNITLGDNTMAPPNRKRAKKSNSKLEDENHIGTNKKPPNEAKIGIAPNKKKQVKGKKRKLEEEKEGLYSENNNKKMNHHTYNVVEIAEEFDNVIMNTSPSASTTSNGSSAEISAKKNTRGNKKTKKNHTVANVETFPLPLSPESDISANHVDVKNKMADEKHDTPTPTRNSRASILKSQRYSSDDLYKPRPFVSGTSRRQRGILNLDKK